MAAPIGSTANTPTLRSVAIGAPAADSRSIVLVDVDGDGDRDVFAATFGSTNLLFLNDGRGHFLDASAQLPPASDGAMSAAAGDFDADGDADLVVGRGDLASGDLATVLLRNNGRGAFALDASAFPSVPSITSQVVAFDADGDLDLDILAVRRSAGGTQAPEGLDTATRLYINDGRGRFAPTTRFPSDARDVGAAAVADLDGDGTLDIALAPGPTTDAIVSGPPLPWRLLLGDGRGGYRDAVASGMSAPTARGRTTAVVSGDLDGDRLPELVAVELLPTGPVLVRYKNLRHAFSRSELALSPPRALALGDVDGDGDLDLAAAGIGLLTSDGRGAFQLVPAQDLASAQVTAAADLDGDSKADVVVGSVTGPIASLLTR